MKKCRYLLFFALLSCCFFMFAACGNDRGKLNRAEPSDILVAYFSCTNHTEGISEKISSATQGTLYEIVPQQPYTEDDLNYGDSSTRATAEQHDPGARPAIDGSVADMGKYDVIFLGYPIWWGEAPKIIYTFLESYNFSGKTIVPFCTSGSSGIGNSANHLHGITKGATWLDGKRFAPDAAQSVIDDWLDGLN